MANVASLGSDFITVYPANATGRPNPLLTIKGSKTRIHNPSAIALDKTGNIYVLNDNAPGRPAAITVYSPQSHGNVEPEAMIRGPNTRLENPSAIATDARGNLYATVAGERRSEDAIVIFPPGADGNAGPARIISGPKTRIRLPGGIAISPKGYIYVTSQQDRGSMAGGTEILVFAPHSSGDIAPVTADDGDCDPARFWTAGPMTVESERNAIPRHDRHSRSKDHSL